MNFINSRLSPESAEALVTMYSYGTRMPMR